MSKEIEEMMLTVPQKLLLMTAILRGNIYTANNVKK